MHCFLSNKKKNINCDFIIKFYIKNNYHFDSWIFILYDYIKYKIGNNRGIKYHTTNNTNKFGILI